MQDIPIQNLTADEIRRKMTDTFKQAEPILKQYAAACEGMAALNEQYHLTRLKEAWPEVRVEENMLAAILDMRASPKTLDEALAQLNGVPVKRIIFDRVKMTFTLYT